MMTKEQRNEWLAWRRIVKEYEYMNDLIEDYDMPDFNSPRMSRLVAAIEVWGEHIAVLRANLSDGTFEGAKEDKYLAACAKSQVPAFKLTEEGLA